MRLDRERDNGGVAVNERGGGTGDREHLFHQTK